MTNKCYICKADIIPFQWQRRAIVECPVCGKYQPSEYLLQNLREYPLPDSYLYSGAIRENYEKGIIPWIEDLQVLLDSVVIPKNPLESVDRILLYVANNLKSADESYLQKKTDYSIAYAKNLEEFLYFLKLARDIGYLENLTANGRLYNVTASGWQRLVKLSQTEIRTNQAFVAMWFNQELYDTWENGIKPALIETGYDPMRIDLTEYNDKIDDRIIAEIRKSGLLIADFTKHRGSVYFEAGFAMGLGIPVIWTCRNDDIENAHFDTRQYNYIVWEDTNDLRIKLINRIEATLPNRPKSKI